MLFYGFYYIYKQGPVYIFAFGEFNSSLTVNVGGIQHFLAQFYGPKLRKETLNAAIIYLVEIKLTKCKYIDRSFLWKTQYITFVLAEAWIWVEMSSDGWSPGIRNKEAFNKYRHR